MAVCFQMEQKVLVILDFIVFVCFVTHVRLGNIVMMVIVEVYFYLKFISISGRYSYECPPDLVAPITGLSFCLTPGKDNE